MAYVASVSPDYSIINWRELGRLERMAELCKLYTDGREPANTTQYSENTRRKMNIWQAEVEALDEKIHRSPANGNHNTDIQKRIERRDHLLHLIYSL